MQDVKLEAVVSSDGGLWIEALPFPAGTRVEVIVRGRKTETQAPPETDRYPLRGKPIRYVDPFEGVATDAWDAMK